MTQVHSKRWLALLVLCLGSLMIVLDTTIVNVALPSIETDLGFSKSTLAWVVNAYMLTFGGFLLLGGRLSDLFGHRRLFIIGVSLFTLASLACGIANTQLFLIVARALQGLSGAIVSAVALSLVMNLFTEPAERAKAMGIFGFVNSGGGSIGVLMGGLLTGSLNWHWIFLVNLPIGILVIVLSLLLLPKSEALAERKNLDLAGAFTITTAMLLAVYAIVNANTFGWTSWQTLGELGIAALLLLIFIGLESRIKNPLMPLRLFRQRNLSIASTIGVLWAGAMFAWFFLSALYLQTILDYNPLQVGLSFLPTNLIMGAFSIGLSAKIVMRFGTRAPLMIGLLCITGGLALFTLAPVDGNYWLHVFPNMMLLGLGAGMAFNPLLLTAMKDVSPTESGLASGMVNTSFMMGGALGLAILASLAASQTTQALNEGTDEITALLSGYHLAFLVGSIFALLAVLLAATLRHLEGQQEMKDTSHTMH